MKKSPEFFYSQISRNIIYEKMKLSNILSEVITLLKSFYYKSRRDGIIVDLYGKII